MSIVDFLHEYICHYQNNVRYLWHPQNYLVYHVYMNCSLNINIDTELVEILESLYYTEVVKST
jgi:hypothetical protein